MIQKIKTISNQYWLVEQLREDKGTIVGNAVVLTKQPMINKSSKSYDNYFFIKNVRLINADRVAEYHEPSELELSFFELLRTKNEITFSKKIADEYEIGQYVMD